jgi:hypothetical protein
MQGDVLDDAVALVEDAKHGDALRHGRHSTLACRSRESLPASPGKRVLLLATLPAGSERERDQQRSGFGPHVYSGIQGS